MSTATLVQTKSFPGEALRYDGTRESADALIAWAGKSAFWSETEKVEDQKLWLDTYEGTQPVPAGFWAVFIAEDFEMMSDEAYQLLFEPRS